LLKGVDSGVGVNAIAKPDLERLLKAARRMKPLIAEK
jgi:hypothetical protein